VDTGALQWNETSKR